MTSDVSIGGLYPQYCLQLSPTFNTWCLMQAADVHALKTVPEYEGKIAANMRSIRGSQADD